jgi:hypothetical protein
MSTEPDMIIDGLGGTSAVAKMMTAPVSTVHSWRKNGIPPSRLAHLKLVAQAEGLPWPINTAGSAEVSPGIVKHVTAAQQSEAA